MSADLERKVREAAEQALDKKRSLLEWTDNAYLYGDGYRDGYLAAATLREEEIEELRAEVNDWRESAKKAAGEPCGDEAHCACVPLLRAEIATLRARVAELEGMVPKWVGIADVRAALALGWTAPNPTPVDGPDGRCWMLMLPFKPQIPVPEMNNNASQ